MNSCATIALQGKTFNSLLLQQFCPLWSTDRKSLRIKSVRYMMNKESRSRGSCCRVLRPFLFAMTMWNNAAASGTPTNPITLTYDIVRHGAGIQSPSRLLSSQTASWAKANFWKSQKSSGIKPRNLNASPTTAWRRQTRAASRSQSTVSRAALLLSATHFDILMRLLGAFQNTLWLSNGSINWIEISRL